MSILEIMACLVWLGASVRMFDDMNSSWFTAKWSDWTWVFPSVAALTWGVATFNLLFVTIGTHAGVLPS